MNASIQQISDVSTGSWPHSNDKQNNECDLCETTSGETLGTMLGWMKIMVIRESVMHAKLSHNSDSGDDTR